MLAVDFMQDAISETKGMCAYGCEVLYFNSLDKLTSHIKGDKCKGQSYSNMSLVDVKEGDIVLCHTSLYSGSLSFGYVKKAVAVDDLPDIAKLPSNGYVLSKLDLSPVFTTANKLYAERELRQKIANEIKLSQQKAIIKALAEANPDLKKLMDQWEQTTDKQLDISITELLNI